MAQKSLVKIIVDPRYPNKAWITEEMIQDQTKAVKHFLDFTGYSSTKKDPTTFSIPFLEVENARRLENHFETYRNSFSLPVWLQIKVE